MSTIFPAHPPVLVPIAGLNDAYFPVHRIYCVGRNYAGHIREMGGSGREAPFFFMKPADAVLPVPSGEIGRMPYPPMTADLHHEVELVVAIGKAGKHIAGTDASQHIWGYAIGLDMTCRDLQAEAKSNGRPWCTSKGFDHSAPIGPIHPVGENGLMTYGELALTVNGEPRQKSDIDKMIWDVAEIIQHLSNYFMLQPGDLIFTGTPEGVAAVKRGDTMQASIDGMGQLQVLVV